MPLSDYLKAVARLLDPAITLAVFDAEGALAARHPADSTLGLGGDCQQPLVAEDGTLLGTLALEPSSLLAKEAAAVIGAYWGQLIQQQALRHTVHEQDTIINHISDGLLVLGPTAIIRYMNATAARLLKLDAVRDVGKSLSSLLDFEMQISRVFTSGQGYIDREVRIESPRHRLHVLDTALPIRDDNGRVVSVVNTFREMARARELSQRLAGDHARYHFSDIIGDAPPLKRAVAAAERAAHSDATVLLQGESGTGKELFAQAIHNDGRRARGPFVALNCAALPRDLIESELFGYVAGSFTGADRAGRPGRFEQASGGTIFLDEISEMPLDVQGKLLRVLQERQVTRIGGTRSIAIDVRVIAAANRILSDQVAQHRFREDLYYRLNVMRIDLPSLHQRRDDIPQLVTAFMQRYCAGLHRSPIQLGTRALERLVSNHWPGNTRQLQNVIERLVAFSDSDRLDDIAADLLSDDLRAPEPPPVQSDTVVLTLDEYEQQGIRLALSAHAFNITRAADALGITRPTLYAKMRRYGFEVSSRLSEQSGERQS